MAAGPVVGGVLVALLGWRSIFFVNVPIGLAALVAALVLVPERTLLRDHRLDLWGMVLSGVGLGALIFALQSGEYYDWGRIAGPVSIPAVFMLGAICLIGFVIRQRCNPSEPLVRPRLFADRDFSAASAAGTAMGAAMGGLFLPLMIYVQSTLGWSPTVSGVITVPMFVLSAVCASYAGRLSDSVGPVRLCSGGFLLLATGLVSLVWFLSPEMNLWSVTMPLLLCGIGIGAVSAPLAVIAARGLESSLVGAASGVFTTGRQLGGAVGGAGTGALLQARIGPTATSATQAALMFSVTMLLIGLGCCAAVRRPAGANTEL